MKDDGNIYIGTGLVDPDGYTWSLDVRGHAVPTFVGKPAQVDRSPEGQDGATRLDRNDESAVAESDARKGESRG